MSELTHGIFDTRKPHEPEAEIIPDYLRALVTGQGWTRTEFVSLWHGPDIEMIVVQSGRASEAWKWTARGWREPDDIDGADKYGWIETVSREKAEAAALRFYMEKDE